MIKKISGGNNKTILWISILVLIIVGSAEITFGIIGKNNNERAKIFREEIRDNAKRIEVVENIAIRNERNNAVLLNEIKNVNKDIGEIKLLLKELHDR